MAATLATAPNQISSPHVLGDLVAVLLTITFSGSYATGGDTVDFTQAVKRGGGKGTVLMVMPEGKAGYEFEYDYTAGKLKVNTTAATELPAAAYPAGLTTGNLRVLVLGR